MPAQDTIARLRGIIVPMLIVGTVIMYLLPPAYFMVKSIATSTPIADVVWSMPRGYYGFWYPVAGFMSIASVVVYRVEIFHARFFFGLGAAAVWLLVTGNVGVYLQLMFPRWLTNAAIIAALAYPPYFVIRWLLKDVCQFSGSALEHLAAFGSFALPLINLFFACMLDEKFFDFYF